MSSANNLEISGKLREYPLAELLAEISQARLNGSLRVGDAQKVVVYFDAGEIVFAVSNARLFRLFEMLLRGNKINKEELTKISDFTNDLLLRQHLLKNSLLSKPELDAISGEQIEAILRDGLNWSEAAWTFSPLIRIRGDIRFKVETNKILMEYARRLPDEAIAGRFRNLQEIFSAKPAMPAQLNLTTQESFVFSRFASSSLSVENLRHISGLSESETLKIIYTLWLGGFLSRQEADSAFSERKTSEILSANFSLIKNQNAPASVQPEFPKFEMPGIAKIEPPTEKTEPAEKKISLEQYLARVEKTTNFYEILDVAPEAIQAEIKQAYFSLAKRFHPDLFHKQADVPLQQRVQQAFGKIAQAYDTLRHEKNREVYNFKVRKELELKEKRPKTDFERKPAEDGDLPNRIEQASDDFEQGFSLLMEEEFEEAIPFLARAVHLANDNARFHAYYGKALASDNKQRHKAEAELQTAVKLDADNADFRIMLAEFFLQFGLPKRAEGELTRLLDIFPANREAKTLLDSLQKK